MSKAEFAGKVSAKGSFHLMWGLICSNIIAAIGSIVIARLLGSDLYGLYVIILSVPTLIGVLRDCGINSAIVYHSAKYDIEGRKDELRNVLISGFLFEIIIGLCLSIVTFILSDFLATTMFNRSNIGSLIQLTSISILASGLINAATAAFTGLAKMEYNSLMLVCQSIIKTLLIILFVILGMGTAGAVLGYTVGLCCAGFIGSALVFTIYRKLPKPTSWNLHLKAYMGVMLRYGLPLSFTVIISSFMTQFYGFLLPIYYPTDNSVIGSYGVAVNFIVLIGFFATPITTMLFPAFSSIDGTTHKQELKNVYRLSVKYSSLLVIPIAALVMCLAGPAVFTLYGDSYTSAPLFLTLLSITYLYTSFGSLSVGNLITGQGETRFILKISTLTAMIGFPLGYIMIMNFGVLGLIITTLIIVIPNYILASRFVKKKYDATFDWRSSVKIVFASGVSGIITYLLLLGLKLASLISLLLGAGFFTVLYLFLILLMKVVEPTDINNFRTMATMTKKLGFLSNALEKILDFVEKTLKR